MHTKTAVIYYSRTGHSKRLALRLSSELGTPVYPITVPRYSLGFLGYMHAGYESLRLKTPPKIAPLPPLNDYDLLILCGPIWTSYPATPLRSFLRSQAHLPCKIALFLTNGSHSPAQKAYDAGEADLERAFVATACLPNQTEHTAKEDETISTFLHAIKGPPGNCESLR